MRHGENSCTERQIRRQTRLRYSRLHPRATLSTPALDLALLFLSRFMEDRRPSISVPLTRTLECKYVPLELARRWTRKIIQSPRFCPGTPFVLASRAGSELLEHGFKRQRITLLCVSFLFFFFVICSFVRFNNTL